MAYKMMKKYFSNKKVLITGHTGFKGSWLSLWMENMGAKVLGISIKNPKIYSSYESFGLKKKIISKNIDIRNFKEIKKEILKFEPNFIFHLAAEAIVKRAFKNPKYAWETNTLGTINILEVLKTYKKKITVIIVTSDKVYKNQEVNKGYKENDILGGLDPYSASKASADLATQSYIDSFLKSKQNIKIAIARAGNVIGGGDWSEGRLVPDCIKNWSNGKIVKLRNPESTRPWQHVLDVLYGYILLSINLNKKKKINGKIFNFGPKVDWKNKVINIVKIMKLYWPSAKWKIEKNFFFKESKLLHLNSSKAKKELKWHCFLNLDETIKFTISWNKTFIKKN